MDKVCKGCLRKASTYNLCPVCMANPTMVYIGINTGFESGIGAWMNGKDRDSYTLRESFTKEEFQIGYDHAENFIKENCN